MNKPKQGRPDGIDPRLDTFSKCFLRSYDEFGDTKVACLQKSYGLWHEYSWKHQYEVTKSFCLGIVRMGLKPKDKVLIMGDNDRRWFWSYIAITAARSVAVPVNLEATPSDVTYIAEHCDAKFAIVGDQEQVDKLLAAKNKCPMLEKLIYWESRGLRRYGDPFLMSFEEVVELGREYAKTHPYHFARTIEVGTGSDIAVIIYAANAASSQSKGIMLTQSNLVTELNLMSKALPFVANDRYVSAVQASNILEQILMMQTIISGTKLYFPEKPESIQEDLREIGPVLVHYSGIFWTSTVSKMVARIHGGSGWKKLIYRLFLPIGYRKACRVLDNKTDELLWNVLYRAADFIVFRALRDKIGLSKCRYCVVESSTTSPDIYIYLRAIGIEAIRTWGTDAVAGIATTQRDRWIERGSGGPPLPGIELRITRDSEIIVRSETVFPGYYRDSESTEIVLAGGWYHSGYAGSFTTDGELISIKELTSMKKSAARQKSSVESTDLKRILNP